MRPDRKLRFAHRLCQLALTLAAIASVSCAPTDKPASPRSAAAVSAAVARSGPRQLSSIEPYLEERVKQLGQRQDQAGEKSKARQLNSIEPFLEERAKQLLGLDNGASRNPDSESSSLTPGGSESGSGGGGPLAPGNSEQSRGRHLYYGSGTAVTYGQPSYGGGGGGAAPAAIPYSSGAAPGAAYGSTYSQQQKYPIVAPLSYGLKPPAYAPERPEDIPKIYEGNKLYLPPGSEAAAPTYPTSSPYGVAVVPFELPVVRPVLELTKPDIKIYSTSKSKHNHHYPGGTSPKRATQKKIISFKEVVGREEQFDADRVLQPEFYIQEEAYPAIVEQGLKSKKKKTTTTTTGAPQSGGTSRPKAGKPRTTEVASTTTTTEAPEPPATEAAPQPKPTAKAVARAKPTRPVEASEPETEGAAKPVEEDAPPPEKEEPGKKVVPRKQVKKKPEREEQEQEPAKQEEEQPVQEEAPAAKQEKPRKETETPEREEQPRQEDEKEQGARPEEEPAPREQVKKSESEEQPEQAEEQQQQPVREERPTENEEPAQPRRAEEEEQQQQPQREPKKSLLDDAGFGGFQVLKDLFGGGGGGGGRSEPESSPQRAALVEDTQEAAPSAEGPSEQPGGDQSSAAGRDQQEARGAPDGSSEQASDEDPEHHDEHDVNQVMGRQAKPPPGLFGDHEAGNPVDELEERMDLLAAIMKNSKEDREALEEAKKVEARPQLLAESDESIGDRKQQQGVGGKSEMENQIDSLRDALSEAIERAGKRKAQSPSSSGLASDSVEVASRGNGQSQDLFGLDFSSLG